MITNTSSSTNQSHEEWVAYMERRGNAVLAAIACVQGLSINDAEAALDHAKDQVRRNSMVPVIPREALDLAFM